MASERGDWYLRRIGAVAIIVLATSFAGAQTNGGLAGNGTQTSTPTPSPSDRAPVDERSPASIWNDLRAHADGGYGVAVGGWCNGGDDTAAFNRTFAAVRARASAMMEMVLPAGICRVNGMSIRSTSGNLYGFRLRGQGENYGAPDATTTSTTLLYTGKSGGTVLEIDNCEWCHVENLTIDGNHLAGRGLQVLSTPKYSGQKSDYSHIVIRNVSQSPFYDADIGGTEEQGNASGDISSNTFSDLTLWISPKGQGIHQFGSQTVTNTYERVHFLSPDSATPNEPVIGFHAEEGEVKLKDCDWITNGQMYDVMLEPYVYSFYEDGSYHEQGAPPAGASTRPPVWSMWGNSAVVNTRGGVVTLQQVNSTPLYGQDFFNIPNDGTGVVRINGVQYTVAAGSVVAPYNSIKLTASAGIQSGVTLTKDNALYPLTSAPRKISNTSVDWGANNGSGNVFYMQQQSSVAFDSLWGYGGGTPTISATVPGGVGVEGFEIMNSYHHAWPVSTSGFAYTRTGSALNGYTLKGATIANPTVTGDQRLGVGSFGSTTAAAGATAWGYVNGTRFTQYGAAGYGQLFGASEPAGTFGIRAVGGGDACVSTAAECTARVKGSNGDLSLSRGGYEVNGKVVIPATATGTGGSGTVVMFGQTCTTASITPSTSAGGTATGTCTLGIAATGHPGVATASDGTTQGNAIPQVTVSGTTVTVTLTSIQAKAGTPKSYTVTVF